MFWQGQNIFFCFKNQFEILDGPRNTQFFFNVLRHVFIQLFKYVLQLLVLIQFDFRVYTWESFYKFLFWDLAIMGGCFQQFLYTDDVWFVFYICVSLFCKLDVSRFLVRLLLFLNPWRYSDDCLMLFGCFRGCTSFDFVIWNNTIFFCLWIVRFATKMNNRLQWFSLLRSLKRKFIVVILYICTGNFVNKNFVDVCHFLLVY